MSTARKYLAPLAVILILLGAWELAARWNLIANGLNIQDFLAFINAFGAGDNRADFNHDGSINIQDFLAYVQAFAAGC